MVIRSAVGVAETLGHIPRGTHGWDKFLQPDELTAMLADAGMRVVDVQGFGWDPLRGARLTDDLKLDYFVSAVPR